MSDDNDSPLVSDDEKDAAREALTGKDAAEVNPALDVIPGWVLGI